MRFVIEIPDELFTLNKPATGNGHESDSAEAIPSLSGGASPTVGGEPRAQADAPRESFSAGDAEYGGMVVAGQQDGGHARDGGAAPAVTE